MQETLEEIFQKMKEKVNSKWGAVDCDLSLTIETSKRASTGQNSHELQRQETLIAFSHNDSSEGDNRSSINSQISYAAEPSNVTSTPAQTPMQRANLQVLNAFGGLGRRKSSASQLNRMDESRSSSHSFSKLNSTMEQVSEELQTRLIITDNSRRNHGVYLTASTPNNSRSPSNSNRDSLISTDSGPPMLPAKRGGNDSNENNSLLNFDANSNASGSREDICIYKPYSRLKKPPPPPPPVIHDNGGSATPPMPRRKPPLRSPTD